MKHAFTFIGIFFLLSTTNGQKLKPTSTNDFVMECMKTNGEGVNKQMVLWLPYNFWEIIGAQMFFIIPILFTAAVIWAITGSRPRETENKTIKKVTEQTQLFFATRKVWTFQTTVELYNRKGQILEQEFYNRNICDSKYTYTYNDFDSLSQVIWFTGKLLTPQKIEKYDMIL